MFSKQLIFGIFIGFVFSICVLLYIGFVKHNIEKTKNLRQQMYEYFVPKYEIPIQIRKEIKDFRPFVRDIV